MRRRAGRRGRPLAHQFLGWQLTVVVVLLAAVAALASEDEPASGEGSGEWRTNPS